MKTTTLTNRQHCSISHNPHPPTLTTNRRHSTFSTRSASVARRIQKLRNRPRAEQQRQPVAPGGRPLAQRLLKIAQRIPDDAHTEGKADLYFGQRGRVSGTLDGK